MASEQEQAQAPYTSNFVRLGRAVWFTLESSFRADTERCAGLEEHLESVGAQVQSVASMGVPWMQMGGWKKRRTWTNDEWVAFLRMWKHHGGFVFEGTYLTEQEKELFDSFLVYFALYANPEGAPDEVSMERANEKVDTELQAFQKRIGDPLEPCAACGKCALGYKLYRCCRCKRVCYCGRDCQSKHWKRHKRECNPSESST